MKDKIAVVVPVYNVENFLERGIDCLLNQSLKELKIVCVNDATQDNSGAILNEYAKKDDRIVVLNHDINKGAGGARNTGLDYIFSSLPEVEFIAFFDADDQLAENAYEIAYNEAKKFGVDILNFNFVPNTHWQYQTVVIGESVNYEGNCLDTIFDHKEFYTFVVCWSKLYKKELLKNIRFNGNRFFEDGGFAYKVLARAKNMRVIPNNFYIYNIENPESTSGKTSNQDRLTAIFNTIKEVCEDWKSLGIFKKYKDKFEQHISLYASLVCPEISEKDKKIITEMLIQGEKPSNLSINQSLPLAKHRNKNRNVLK